MEDSRDENRFSRTKNTRKRPALQDCTNQIYNGDAAPKKRIKHEEPFVEPTRAASGNFAKLPDEILEKIITSMDTNSKLNSSLACKRFNQLISAGVGLEGVEYTYNFDTDDIVIPRRHYQAIKIKRFAGEVTVEQRIKILQVFEAKSEVITSVKFSSCNISQGWIGAILGHLPLTSSLSFENCLITRSVFSTPMLSFLESLEVEQNVMPLIYKILKGVGTLKKVSLTPNKQHLNDESDSEDSDYEDEILDRGNRSDDENSDTDEEMEENFDRNYRDFLGRQRKLKSLSISHGSFFNQRFTNCRFQLQEIDLFFRVLYAQSVFLLAFLLEQLSISDFSANIKSCECEQLTPQRNLRNALGHILHLQTLKTFRWIFYDTELLSFYKDCRIVNENVKQLYLNFCGLEFFHQRIIEATTKMFPAVKSLHLNFDAPWLNREQTTPQTFEPLNALTDLKVLKLEYLESHFITALKLPRIESFLLLRNLDKDEKQRKANWKCFFKNNLRYRKQDKPPKGTFSHLKKFASCRMTLITHVLEQ